MTGARVTLETIPCPICGSPDHEPVLTAPDQTGAVEGEFTVVRCGACDLSYLNPRPTPESLSACYAADYGPHADPTSGRRRKLSILDRLVLRHCYGWPLTSPSPGRPHPTGGLLTRLLGPRRERFERNKKNLRFFPFEKRGRLLDLGCGAGGYLALLAGGGWDVKGIEIDPVAAERARAHHGLSVHTGTVHDAPFASGSFDAVVMSHVLEHVPDPVEVLAAVRELLAPGGLLVLSVPVRDGEAAEKLGPWWYGLELPRHLLHFSRTRLTTFLKAAGFEVARTLDDPAGDGWRWTFKHAPEELKAEQWLARLATDKKHRHRHSANLAANHRSSFVVVHARR